MAQAHFTDSFPTLSLSPIKVVSLSRLNSKHRWYWTLFLQEPKEMQAVYSPHKGKNCSFKSSKDHSSGPEGLNRRKATDGVGVQYSRRGV